MRKEKKTLTSMLVTAGTAMVALTSIAIVFLALPNDGTSIANWRQIVVILLSSSCATILVLGLLHSDLQTYYTKLSERELSAQRDARLDGLTRLANRKAFLEDLEQLASTPAGSTENFLAIMDLDEFKNVNDTMGHGAGDALLAQVARRMCVGLPSTCKPYRLGGDEFAIILSGETGDKSIEICEGIRGRVIRDYCISGSHISVGCSIGISELEPGVSISEALQHSDLAMYEAKISRAGVKLFDEPMASELKRKTDLTSRLKIALNDQVGISTAYQPIVSPDMKVAALEGFFRWRDNHYGVIGTKEAIEVATKNRLLNKITLFVLEQTCLEAELPPDIKFCFNLEPVQLLDRSFMDELSARIFAGPIQHHRIQLEFSERYLVDYCDKLGLVLQKLVDQGLRLAVDDFGSSNASLTQLAKLGITEVKLDPSVLRFARESGNISVMRAKTSLAHSLGMLVTCKGISCDEERAIAEQSGCDFLQGYHLGRPSSLEIFRRSLSSADWPAAA